jgi:Cu(I)/Ag(I) efflux system membrane fusion protein
MHPEVVAEEPEECPRCGMTLVTTESLGYVRGDLDEEAPIVIPVSAPLVTGKRAVVYVRVPDAANPTFEGREIVLGPRAGEVYVVREGLTEGEEVVVHGAFRIDSSLQILGRPSMLSLDGGGEGSRTGDGEKGAEGEIEREEAPAALQRRIGELFVVYRPLQAALAADDAQAAREAASRMRREIESGGPPDEGVPLWNDLAQGLATALARIEKSEDIQGEREAFLAVSNALRTAVLRFGHRGGGPIHVVHCPMAFDNRGADWLQADREIANPYFGDAMLRCGEVRRTVEPVSDDGGR